MKQSNTICVDEEVYKAFVESVRQYIEDGQHDPNVPHALKEFIHSTYKLSTDSLPESRVSGHKTKLSYKLGSIIDQ
jgi:hypothetical protein